MAYDPNELFAEHEGLGSGLRVEAHTIQPKTFAQGEGTIPILAPVMFNTITGFWEIWSSDGGTGDEAGDIAGFLWPGQKVPAGSGEAKEGTQGGLELVSDAEVLGNVLLRGIVHFDDISLPDGEDLDDLKAACRKGLREKGIIIQGLDQVR
jgi:hypothetical protein